MFVFLNIYGIGKIIGGQFYRPGHLPADVAQVPLGQAGAFELACTSMGHSFVYILFIGAVEVIGAWLLLWNEPTVWCGDAAASNGPTSSFATSCSWTPYGALASAIIYTASAIIYTGLLLLILACHWQGSRRPLSRSCPPGAPTPPNSGAR
ncbi:MAG TPA: hypothetical protein VES20_25390 [Bryobacteraceae bacterium]|nr:hypothetical protein [Bryobacteraceae bacterium]